MLKILRKNLQNVHKEIGCCPEGWLRVETHGKHVKFFQVTVGCRRGIGKKPDTIRALTRKKFLEIQKKHIEEDIKQIEKIAGKFCSYDFGSILDETKACYKNLPDEYFDWTESGTGTETTVPAALRCSIENNTLSDFQREEIREIQRQWANTPYRKSDKNPAGRKKVTSRGLKVRSKSEVIIAELLYKHDVPFRYEQLIFVGGGTVLAPDFTFLNVLQGEIYWEHAGMPDNPEYRKRHFWKRGIYESMGIYPWKNYIETYDNEKGSCDADLIEAEICNKLLKRLMLK